MAKLIYSTITSLDGYVEDRGGGFEWAAPGPEVHAFGNELERPIGTYLYGRRMYETMVYWEDPPELASQEGVIRDYAGIWQAAEKVVYSTTLHEPASARKRSVRRATTVTPSPRAASCRAISAPIPEEAPVTRQVLSCAGAGSAMSGS